ncbi:MAG: hypothetical protein ABIO02_02145 [Patescibacteria group bacterium]
MKKSAVNSKKIILSSLAGLSLFTSAKSAFAKVGDKCVDGWVNGIKNGQTCVQVDTSDKGLGFAIPTLAEILTFAIRLVFVAGGLAALVMLLLGAFAWITSGGEKEKTKAAQEKIQAAVIGVILIAVVLAVVVTLEQVVFAGNICLGLSCGITIPSLLKPAP